MCQMTNYRERVFNQIKNLKRLDGIPINIEFVVPKELIQNNDDIEVDTNDLYWYAKKFPEVSFEKVTFKGDGEIKDKLEEIKDLEFRASKMMKNLLTF